MSKRPPIASILGHAALLATLLIAGCAVPQPPGAGKMSFELDPGSGRRFFLYLPEEYVKTDEAERAQRRWPLVMTFHGMKPYDTSIFQIREWQEEADRYGFVVVAPELLAFDQIIGEFPQNSINILFKSDEQASLSIMDHVIKTTGADGQNVLSTGFSSGGYLAHYMLNRHPDRFSCLAARQADYSAAVLDSSMTAHSRNTPVLITNTEHDVPICKEESREAIRWYEAHGYRKLAWLYVRNLAHERTPDVAAAFFARCAGVTARTPPKPMEKRKALDGNATGLALLSGQFSDLPPPPRESAGAATPAPTPKNPPSPRPPAPVAAPRAESPPRRAATTAPRSADPPAGSESPPPRSTQSTLEIELSAAQGHTPFTLAFEARSPADWKAPIVYYWTLNGQRIAEGRRGERSICEPGEYALELLAVTQDGVEHRASKTVRALGAAEAAGGRPGAGRAAP